MDRLEKKIDRLIDGQTMQALSIQKLQDTISNGMRGDLKRTIENVTEMQKQINVLCRDYDDRLKLLENFSWFRNWINKMRDNFLQTVIVLAIMGSLIYLATHFGGLLIKRLLG